MNSLEPSFFGLCPGPHIASCRRHNVDLQREAGASEQDHRPLSAVPSRAAKHAGKSKRGRHNQSIEPSRPTNVAVLVADQRIIFDGQYHCPSFSCDQCVPALSGLIARIY